ncbi:MAG: hypothetical protein PHV74_12945 [Dehalococcoidia bacterium]|nr:hypothetical protein [Dehalococcoidia bacterium]
MIKLSEKDVKAVASDRYMGKMRGWFLKVWIPVFVVLCTGAVMIEADGAFHVAGCVLLGIAGVISMVFWYRYVKGLKSYTAGVLDEVRRFGCQAVIDGSPVQPRKR